MGNERGRSLPWAAFVLAFASLPLRAAAPAGQTLAGWLRSGTIDGRLRAYYMNRDYSSRMDQESLAGGGWLRYETPPVRGVRAGLAGYLSNRFGIVPGGRDGANLLGPGQTSFAVLGQAYVLAEFGPHRLRLYRQSLETPFLNGWDVKMIPVAHEAYTLTSTAVAHLELTLSHVTRIKPWTAARFLTMSEAAGFPGTDHPVTVAAAAYRPKTGMTFQAWEYYADDFMSLLYGQADTRWDLRQDLALGLSAQGVLERDVGKALGGDIETGMLGARAQVFWKSLTAQMGATFTDRHGVIINPWGGYPGYTSIMEEDCDQAGEQAWLLGLAYDFKETPLKGLTVSSDYTQSSLTHRGWSSPFQHEADVTADYRFPGWAKGLWLRLRYAQVYDSHTMHIGKYEDYRAILNFDF